MSTSSAVPCITISLDGSGTENKGVTFPEVSHWGDSSVGYLIKGVSEVRRTAQLSEPQITGFKELFSLEKCSLHWLLHAPLFKYPISNKTCSPTLPQSGIKLSRQMDETDNYHARGDSHVQHLARTPFSLLHPFASCKDDIFRSC